MPTYVDKNDPKKQGISAAQPVTHPSSPSKNTGALEFNLTDEAFSIFNPHATLSALQTFHGLNQTVNKLFGMESRWFRAVPQQRSKDIIFKEYTLSNVEDEPLCIKVLVPDGNFPEDNYQYDLMGLEYQIPLEVHLDKGYWEEEAGFGTAPQRKDIVYLTLPNRLYQVESAFLKRQFMQQETTWVVNLGKYQPEASRKEGEALKETINKYTVSEEELFGEDQRKEIEKISIDKQTSPFNTTSQDKYKSIDPDLKIISGNIDIYGIIAAQSFYDLESSGEFNAIVYNASDKITESDDRAVTAWIYQKETNLKEYNISSITKNNLLAPPANYEITISNTSDIFEEDDMFIIYRTGALNFYAKVIDTSTGTPNLYYCEIDEDVERYLSSIKSTWNNLKYKMQLKNPVTILDGINGTSTGFVVSIIANQYVRIIYGSQKHVACLDEKLDDNKWYGVVANIGNTWGQYNVYIWEEIVGDRDQKLKIKFYDTLNFTPEQTIVDRYTVDKSYAYITNIRLFKATIEEEKQTKELLSYFTKNADYGIILDNCDLKMLAPYVSTQR